MGTETRVTKSACKFEEKIEVYQVDRYGGGISSRETRPLLTVLA